MSATQHSRPQQLGGDRHARQLCHADRRRVDDAVGAPATAAARSIRPRPLVRRRPTEAVTQALPPGRPDIGDQQPFDAAVEQRVGHRRPGAAGAQQQHLPTLRAGHAAAKTLPEAPHVGVVADAAAAPEHDGVDRANLGCLGQLVEQRNDFLLVGKGDVEAGEAEMLGKGDDICQGGAVSPIGSVSSSDRRRRALRPALSLVHGRRAGMLDAAPEQADQHAARTGRPPPNSRRRR